MPQAAGVKLPQGLRALSEEEADVLQALGCSGVYRKVGLGFRV